MQLSVGILKAVEERFGKRVATFVLGVLVLAAVMSALAIITVLGLQAVKWLTSLLTPLVLGVRFTGQWSVSVVSSLLVIALLAWAFRRILGIISRLIDILGALTDASITQAKITRQLGEQSSGASGLIMDLTAMIRDLSKRVAAIEEHLITGEEYELPGEP